ncbi:oligopeptide/dipeptide ABC transporter, ATP- binding protein [Salinarchaeum sp. Harcht-Bsk1]|uniref:hypothetical protein n=1 Tax=Salinarchaeum sp. Harcht-Bsk1 TaxID=1333523 RepID=UPI000342346B|nr:hypothetical protein [Salinarchaeum sp. Harcht-Bsk1]AGN00364.1 oligopeptide/dipeptide ABC transporter, ATP- binding protein [Salinarchaeum sp. Harcht-Bsk1]
MTDEAFVARAPLYVESDLTLTFGDNEVPVRSTGDRLFLEFPSISSALGATRGFPTTQRGEFHDVLTAADLALEIRARDRTIATLGAGTRAGPLSRQLGVAPAAIRLGGILSAGWATLNAVADLLR